jgi:internalin A
MRRIAACAMLWFCAGCVGDQSERPTLLRPNADKSIASSSAFVQDENKPGHPVVSAYLSGTKVTDADMKDLADLKQLQTLDLRNTSVTDTGLKDLAALTQLRELYLIGTNVTNAGLKEVATLKQLQKLYLVGAKVTDAGLKDLVNLKQLQELNLSDTMVTDAGRRELQKALPACQVVR